MSNRLVDRLHPLAPQGTVKRTLFSASDPDYRHAFGWIQELSTEDFGAAVDQVCRSSTEEWTEDASTFAAVLVEVLRRLQQTPLEISSTARVAVRDVYPALGTHPALQSLVLRMLIAARDPASLRTFSDLLVEHPPLETRLQVEVFAELWKLSGAQAAALFPGILRGLQQPGLASFVLDYANYTFRSEKFSVHPARERAADLISLLSGLADRLGKLQDAKPTNHEEATQLGKQVTESVALAVALCDALASIGDPQAVGALNKVLQIEHRRLRVEAAAALAKLGVEDAKKILVALAAEPIERLRVLRYADELDLLAEVDEQFSNPVAQAEAEIVMHLAEPTQIGIAPQHIELIDQRELAWPGFEEPRNCYLFQYVYEFPHGQMINVGLAGPVVMTFQADLSHLSAEDQYAIFAGWHVEHPDIFAVAPDRVVGDQQQAMERLLSALMAAHEYEDVRPALLGSLLGCPLLVAAAERQAEPGWVMVGDDAIQWLPLGNPQAPLGSGEAFYLFVGRALLSSFN